MTRLWKERKGDILMEIKEQEAVLSFDKRNLIVSASAGSGKTYILIKLITKLICEKRVPIRKLLILTFTKNASVEMKERLLKNLKGIKNVDDFILKQIDDLSVSNISTIHSYCEHCLKKYANILKLKENFTLADENLSYKLKKEAIKKSLKKLKNDESFFKISYAFISEQKLFDAIMEVNDMMEAVADKESYIEKILTKQNSIFDEAEEVVKKNLDSACKLAEERIEKAHLDFDFKLKGIYEGSLLDKAKFLETYTFPRLPSAKIIGEENLSLLKGIKKDLQTLFEDIKGLSLTSEKIEEERKGELEILLTKLYVAFSDEYKKLKNARNILDFSDLEQNMLSLIANDLFNEKFEYVFIDEYQDTNSLQERIVKTVAKNSHFVAVGDAKQGIYGFRLASSKIFLKDVEDFMLDEKDEALFLKSNFRTSEKILDFINSLFKDAMTKENANIDYKNTAMLEAKKDFKDDGVVVVDMLVPDEVEEEELQEIYSVKEATLSSNEYKKELQVVLVRIEEALKSKIYDPELETYRQCEFKDIAILSRSRSPFFNRLAEFLKEKGYPVTANKKKNLLDTPEIKVLHNILKVTLDHDDEIALLSVLMSNFGRLNQDDILRLRKGGKLYEEAKTSKAIELLEEFKKDGVVYGYRRAFELLFDKTGYYAYVNEKSLRTSVNKFLDEIENSTYDHDLPSLISYFENVDVEDVGEASGENAILLTTIHKTKGLEYPVVILIGAGKSLKKQERHGEIAMDENFGIAVKRYEEGQEEKTVKLLAIRYLDEQKRFQEEMMIFYVALTRAKNRLYIIGEYKNPYSIKFDCYFDYIFASLSPNELESLLKEESLEKGAVSYHIITEVEDFEIEEKSKIFGKGDEKTEEAIKKYLDFSYPFKKEENIAYKNSVTSLTKKYEEQEVFLPSSMVEVSLDAVEIGNAYHLALKTVDFNEINCKDDLEKYFTSSLNDIKNKIDLNLLYKNIELLKPFTKSGSAFKEQEFVMRDALNNLIKNVEIRDEILVQGVVDLFIVNGDKAILIDYKYSSTKNREKLIGRYKTQLYLYKNAIESGLNVKVEKMYLLNLKYTDLIEINEE